MVYGPGSFANLFLDPPSLQRLQPGQVLDRDPVTGRQLSFVGSDGRTATIPAQGPLDQQSFTYDLEELADFYLEYRRMMTHWDAVLPGAVLELRYENMVRSQEAETRRLLAFCGLPWDERCLRFHETERAVRTASSEQVRMPLYDSALGRWRNYRAQLSPLIEILEPELRREGWEL